MSKDKTRIFVTEIVEHIFVLDSDKLDEKIDRITRDSSWKVKPVGWDEDDYIRDHASYNLEVE